MYQGEVFHGGAGCKDIEITLLSNGFKPIVFPYQYDFSLIAKVSRLLIVFKYLIGLPLRSIVFFQTPMYAKAHEFLIKLVRRFRKDVRIVCFITDIEGLRDGNNELLCREKKTFTKLTYFIVHNDAMKRWLLKVHPKAISARITFFDYLEPAGYDINRGSVDYSIAFAGFLEKSKFVSDLYRLGNLRFHLYGQLAKPLDISPNIIYHGVFPRKDLLQRMEGAFGLVWDGDSIKGLEGAFGTYLQYNSPNKLSLYILKGLPIIVHKEAASAAIVQQYKIGFSVSSLFEIENCVRGLTEQEYLSMRNNCIGLAEKIKSGGCLISALADLGIDRMHFDN
jgi:hypothetical protein